MAISGLEAEIPALDLYNNIEKCLLCGINEKQTELDSCLSCRDIENRYFFFMTDSGRKCTRVSLTTETRALCMFDKGLFLEHELNSGLDLKAEKIPLRKIENKSLQELRKTSKNKVIDCTFSSKILIQKLLARGNITIVIFKKANTLKLFESYENIHYIFQNMICEERVKRSEDPGEFIFHFPVVFANNGHDSMWSSLYSGLKHIFAYGARKCEHCSICLDAKFSSCEKCHAKLCLDCSLPHCKQCFHLSENRNVKSSLGSSYLERLQNLTFSQAVSIGIFERKDDFIRYQQKLNRHLKRVAKRKKHTRGKQNLTKDVKNEQEESEEEDECCICLDNKAEMTFTPCNHVITCKACSVQLKKCPFCRKDIDSIE